MRPGREAGGTYISDQLPHMNACARLHLRTDLRQMTVDADQIVLMLDADRVPELALPSRADHGAIGDTLNRFAVLCDQINADVRAVFVEDRMIAMEGEAR